jgi:hypothetical protein
MAILMLMLGVLMILVGATTYIRSGQVPDAVEMVCGVVIFGMALYRILVPFENNK